MITLLITLCSAIQQSRNSNLFQSLCLLYDLPLRAEDEDDYDAMEVDTNAVGLVTITYINI